MKSIEKLISVVMKNAAYSITLLIAIILFAVFSDGLLNGLITALSAVIAFVCIELLYKEFKKEGTLESSMKKSAMASKPKTGAAKTDSKKKK